MRRRSLMLGSLAATLPLSARAQAPAVVLELFTSQGCSSCPPADALLGVLERERGVIALAWHVDYWNGLGWRDPFATRLSTDRQRAYAARLGSEVYTPALVVNGAAIVVGSDESAIARVRRQVSPLRTAVSLRAGRDALIATFDPAAKPAHALLATYDPQRDTAVGAGENGGRRLREYHIVRSVSLAPAAELAAGRIAFPAVPAGRGAAVLLQSADLRVIGAASLA